MFPKSSKESDSIDELKKEIQLNEAMDKKLVNGCYDAAFIKGTADNTNFLDVVPPQRQQTSPWVNPAYKNWVLFAFATVAFIVLLILILADGTGRAQHYVEEWPAIHSAGFHSSNHIVNDSESKVEAQVQEMTTTTTTTTTTPAPTTQKMIHYLLASVIVNNATVPQMDKTILHQFSRADAYVILYLIEGTKHRKVGQTGVDKNTMSPKWNYLFEHKMKVFPDSLLNFEIYDFDNVGTDERIGNLYVKVGDLIDQDLNGQIVKRHYGRGYLWFTVHWEEVYRYV